jgi:hypothetical protein
MAVEEHQAVEAQQPSKRNSRRMAMAVEGQCPSKRIKQSNQAVEAQVPAVEPSSKVEERNCGLPLDLLLFSKYE